jgi:hypothetical protein
MLNINHLVVVVLDGDDGDGDTKKGTNATSLILK